MRVFVSSQDVDAIATRALIDRLRGEGYSVDHSPRNPMSGEKDLRWPNWYSVGLNEALSGVDFFIIVIDRGWDSSTWMGQEAHYAIELGLAKASFFWNPERLVVRAPGMLPYLKSQLPSTISDLVSALESYRKP